MLGAAVFRAMKQSAWVVDISGRIPILDYPALVQAIAQDWIARICTQPPGHDPSQGGCRHRVRISGSETAYTYRRRGTSLEQMAAGVDLFFSNLRAFESGGAL